MPFASRSDLLARSNARRLAQLAVPADYDMVPDDALRAAIEGGDLSGYDAGQREALTLALDASDCTNHPAVQAGVHCGALLPAGRGTQTDDVRKAYEGAVDTLKEHAKGIVNLIPALPTGPVLSDDTALIVSERRR